MLEHFGKPCLDAYIVCCPRRFVSSLLHSWSSHSQLASLQETNRVSNNNLADILGVLRQIPKSSHLVAIEKNHTCGQLWNHHWTGFIERNNMKQHETKHQKTSKVQCKTMLCDAHWVTFDTLRLCSSRNHRGARGWESWARNQDPQPCDIDTDATMWHWMWYSYGLDWFGMDSLRLWIWYLSNSFDTFWQEVWNRFLCSLSHESAQSRYHLEGQGWGGNVGMWRHKVKSHDVGTVGMYFNFMYSIIFLYYIL